MHVGVTVAPTDLAIVNPDDNGLIPTASPFRMQLTACLACCRQCRVFGTHTSDQIQLTHDDLYSFGSLP